MEGIEEDVPASARISMPATVHPSVVGINGTYRIVQYSEVSLSQGFVCIETNGLASTRIVESVFYIEAVLNSGVSIN